MQKSRAGFQGKTVKLHERILPFCTERIDLDQISAPKMSGHS